MDFTESEQNFCRTISQKDLLLRSYLAENRLSEPINSGEWLAFLTGIKNILGNLNNDVSFVATLLIKSYLRSRFLIADFDAGGKAQGAPGIDIEAKTADGKIIIGELKTTKPYQPGFGAAQRTTIFKDLDRLRKTPADFRFMFVTDDDTFQTLNGKSFRERTASIEVVNITEFK